MTDQPGSPPEVPERPRLSAGNGRLIVLSGPSGAGKDTVLHEMFRRDGRLRYSVSYTTRPPRPGEVEGTSYSFVDEPVFWSMWESGELLEWARVHDHLYGTSRTRVQEALDRGEDIVLKIDVQGAKHVRDRVPAEAIFIFLEAPSMAELRRRLVERDTEDETALELRVRNAEDEMAEAVNYDHRVVNDSVERAAAEILEIVEASRRAATGRPGG